MTPPNHRFAGGGWRPSLCRFGTVPDGLSLRRRRAITPSPPHVAPGGLCCGLGTDRRTAGTTLIHPPSLSGGGAFTFVGLAQRNASGDANAYPVTSPRALGRVDLFSVNYSQDLASERNPLGETLRSYFIVRACLRYFHRPHWKLWQYDLLERCEFLVTSSACGRTL